MLSQRKIKQVLTGYTIVLNNFDKQWKLLKDGKVVLTTSSFCINHKVQAEVIFAEKLLQTEQFG